MLLQHRTMFLVKSVLFLLIAILKIKGNLALILLQKFLSKYLFCVYSEKQRTVHRTELVCQTPFSDITYYNMWVWMNKKLSESPTPSSIACIWTIHGCKGLTMRSESRNSLSNFKEIQTCFDISEQKDGCIQLLVYCSSISSNFDCSELRVKKRRKKIKKVVRK